MGTCYLRKCPVVETPEEIVRQKLIRRLVDTLGYSASLMLIEKKLSEIPNIKANASLHARLPHRRVDLLIYSPAGYPLLLIECKAERLTPRAVRQVLAYNAFIGARASALVNDVEEICMIDGRSIDSLPHFSELAGMS